MPAEPGIAFEVRSGTDERLVAHVRRWQSRSEERAVKLPSHSHLHASTREGLGDELGRLVPECVIGWYREPMAESMSISWKTITPPGRTRAAIRRNASAGSAQYISTRRPATAAKSPPMSAGRASPFDERDLVQAERFGASAGGRQGVTSTSTLTTLPSGSTRSAARK